MSPKDKIKRCRRWIPFCVYFTMAKSGTHPFHSSIFEKSSCLCSTLPLSTPQNLQKQATNYMESFDFRITPKPYLNTEGITIAS